MSTIDLHFKLLDGSGNPLRGTVSARLSTVVRDPGSDAVYTTNPVTARLVSGEATLSGLLTTDTSGLSPQGWRWVIETQTNAAEVLTEYARPVPRSSTVELASSPSGVAEYADLVTVETPDPTVSYPTQQDIQALEDASDEATATANAASADASNAVSTADSAEDSVTALSDSQGQPGGIATLNAGGLLTGSQAYVTSVDSQQGAVDLSGNYADKGLEDTVAALAATKPRIELTLTSDQSVAASSGQNVVWDVAVVNDVFSWSSGAEVTIPEDGLYILTAQIQWELSSDTGSSERQRGTFILLNGDIGNDSIVSYSEYVESLAPEFNCHNVSRVTYLTTGDVIKLRGYSGSPNAQNMRYDGRGGTWLSIAKL